MNFVFRKNLIKKNFKHLLTALLLGCALLSQGLTSSDSIQKINPSDEAILKYEEFLRHETESHRAYIQDYYDMIWKLLATASIAVGVVLTWMNWKSRDDIRKQINEKFKDSIQSL